MALSDVLSERVLTPENLDEVLYYISGDGNLFYGKEADQVAYHLAALARILIELDNPNAQKVRVLWQRTNGAPVPRELFGLSDVELLCLCNKLWRATPGE